jgi:hypothetical protein
MGIFSGVFGDQNPVSQFLEDNRHTVRGAFAGFGTGTSFGGGLSRAVKGAANGGIMDDEARTVKEQEAERQQSINQTVEYMRAKGFDDLVSGVESGGMDMGAAWSEALRRGQPKPAGEAFTLGAGETRYAPDGSVLAQGAPDQQDQFGNEKDLYAQYAASDPVKMYETVKGGYERVRQSAALQTGAGDMGLIYGYMKMLDPGSVVREAEFATAAQSGSYGQQIQGMVSRIMNGERLPEDVRQQFVQSAEGIYSETSQNLGDINSQFSTRAQSYGVDPGMFIRQPEAYQPLQGIVTMPNGNTVRPM